MSFLRAALLAISLLGPARAFAADPITDAMTAAYVPYRTVLFRTNSKAQIESEQAISQARKSWSDLSSKFAAAAQPPYDRDPNFGKSLAEVASVYEKAEAEIRAQKLTEAHETLEEAREIMAELRRRNNVVVYSDHMNAYHLEMERLLNEGPKWLGESQGFMLLMETLGSMQFLVGRLRSEAPATVVSDPAFQPALKSVEQSLGTLREATLAQDASKVRAALSKIKGPYSQLFLKFG